MMFFAASRGCDGCDKIVWIDEEEISMASRVHALVWSCELRYVSTYSLETTRMIHCFRYTPPGHQDSSADLSNEPHHIHTSHPGIGIRNHKAEEAEASEPELPPIIREVTFCVPLVTNCVICTHLIFHEIHFVSTTACCQINEFPFWTLLSSSQYSFEFFDAVLINEETIIKTTTYTIHNSTEFSCPCNLLLLLPEAIEKQQQ